MGNEEKHPFFQVYRPREVLVTIDEAEAMRAKLSEGLTFDGRRGVYQHKSLEYRTFGSLAVLH